MKEGGGGGTGAMGPMGGEGFLAEAQAEHLEEGAEQTSPGPTPPSFASQVPERTGVKSPREAEHLFLGLYFRKVTSVTYSPRLHRRLLQEGGAESASKLPFKVPWRA